MIDDALSDILASLQAGENIGYFSDWLSKRYPLPIPDLASQYVVHKSNGHTRSIEGQMFHFTPGLHWYIVTAMSQLTSGTLCLYFGIEFKSLSLMIL